MCLQVNLCTSFLPSVSLLSVLCASRWPGGWEREPCLGSGLTTVLALVCGFHFPALTRVLSLLRRARTPICRFPVSLAVQRQRAHSWASFLTLVWLAAVSRPLLLRVSGRPASFIRRACELTLQDLARSWQWRCMTVVSFVPVVCVTGRGSVLLLGRV